MNGAGTIEGYRVLLQKEFVAFGHMCKKRLGTACHPDQRSPCYHLLHPLQDILKGLNFTIGIRTILLILT